MKLKNLKIIVVAMTLFSIITTNAQEIITTNAQEIVFGVKTGLNFSKFGGDVNADGRTSFFIGGVADITITDELHIQPELLFSGEGSEDLKANFIRAIGVVKYFVAEGFSLQGGLNIGIRISGDSEVEDSTKSFDFGLAIGAGYEIKELGLFFDTRYNLGIANLADGNFDTNLGTFQLGIGYKFY